MIEHHEKLQRKAVVDLAEKIFIYSRDLTISEAIFAAEKFKQKANEYINKRGDYEEK